jgi:hypothetical protein
MLFMQAPSVGGDATAWLASDAALEGVTGRYQDRRRVATTHVDTLDEALAADMWRASEQAAGLAGDG